MEKLTFERWMERVNEILAQDGLDYRDLPDCPYHQWYEDGMRPATAATKALRDFEFG